jgi:hypothetical protein
MWFSYQLLSNLTHDSRLEMCNRQHIGIRHSTEGYFCDGMRRNAALEILSQKDASQNGVPEPFYPGIDI